ncbi:MAG: chorismate lyase [Candidatus Thioglobus sp.]|jgi:chorismate--pyruvate lyase|nr:MAG: chorismate lyase [Candidatus Thioglobus sp.]RUM81243.1 MAG: chorismate lyase [Candidatus Thioglobus sp.]RUM85449.1 MAG: chorismate lyase [Candidatus Thioglobus sp.]RUM86466.1 MAG: chorismate lyase [Candidatus Thioglobus sp.]
MINTQDLTWENLTNTSNVPESVLGWLDDEQSLTAKLKQKFDDFSVNVLSQIQTTPHNNENEMLDFEGQSVIREVQLLGNHQVVVFARSVIPVTGDTQAILKIGSKPLGEILFNDPDIKRGQLQITHTGSTWGRRSTFTIGTTKLLVSEFFLECLYA